MALQEWFSCKWYTCNPTTKVSEYLPTTVDFSQIHDLQDQIYVKKTCLSFKKKNLFLTIFP